MHPCHITVRNRGNLLSKSNRAGYDAIGFVIGLRLYLVDYKVVVDATIKHCSVT